MTGSARAVKASIQAGAFADAERQALAALRGESDSEEATELLYLLAVAQRYLENFDAALEVIERIPSEMDREQMYDALNNVPRPFGDV